MGTESSPIELSCSACGARNRAEIVQALLAIADEEQRFLGTGR
mgnify:CR=1 FL=1